MSEKLKAIVLFIFLLSSFFTVTADYSSSESTIQTASVQTAMSDFSRSEQTRSQSLFLPQTRTQQHESQMMAGFSTPSLTILAMFFGSFIALFGIFARYIRRQ